MYWIHNTADNALCIASIKSINNCYSDTVNYNVLSGDSITRLLAPSAKLLTTKLWKRLLSLCFPLQPSKEQAWRGRPVKPECSDIAINLCVIVLYRSCLIKSMPGGPQLCLAYPPRQFLFVKNDVLYVICTVCSRLQLRGMLS